MYSYKSRNITNPLQIKRIEKGLTQAQLADKTGIPLSTVQGIERGKLDIQKVAGITLLKFAEVLNCKIEDFLK
jgi:transcriptional regulator with XRE-family HTH domain